MKRIIGLLLALLLLAAPAIAFPPADEYPGLTSDGNRGVTVEGAVAIRLSCGGENGSTSGDVSGAYTWRSLSIDVSGLSAGWYVFAIQWLGQSATTLMINGFSIRRA